MENQENTPLNCNNDVKIELDELVSRNKTEPRKRLIRAYKSNDIDEFRKIISSVDLDTFKLQDEFEDDKNLFETICSSEESCSYVKSIIEIASEEEMRRMLNSENEQYKMTPLQFAQELYQLDTFHALCDTKLLNTENIFKSFYKLIEDLHRTDIPDDTKVQERFSKIDFILTPNEKYLCDIISEKNLEKLIRLANEKKISYVMDLLAQNVLNLCLKSSTNIFLEIMPQDLANLIILFVCVARGDSELFESTIKKIKNKIILEKPFQLNQNSHFKIKKMSILQFACNEGCDQCVNALLESNVERNDKFGFDDPEPICLACTNGHYKILSLLLNDPLIRVNKENTSYKSLFEYVVVKPRIDEIKSHERCLRILIADSRTASSINMPNYKGSTALHQAAVNRHETLVTILLENGASINTFDYCNRSPLYDISPVTFENYLNTCMTSNSEDTHTNYYYIEYNYSFLKPVNSLYQNEWCGNEVFQSKMYKNAPEMNALVQMTRIPSLRHLLKHPVITSFIFLKWHRIKYLYYLNVLMYTLFFLSLIVFTVKDRDEPNRNIEIVKFTFIICTLIFVTGREAVQCWKYPLRYVKNWENLLEAIMIILTITTVIHKILVVSKVLDENEFVDGIRHLMCLTAILLATGELILLAGKMPIFSTYFIMFYTVSRNVFKFTWLFFSLFFSFAVIFHILFRSTDTENGNMFETIWSSMFKTFIMFTGEFDAGSINFSYYPVFSRSVFTIFIFLVTIVLFNLLNGLAISDIQFIKADAEFLELKSKLETLSFVESIFFGEDRKIEDYDLGTFCRNFIPPFNPAALIKYPDFSKLSTLSSVFSHDFVLKSNKARFYVNSNNRNENQLFSKWSFNKLQMRHNIVKETQSKITEQLEANKYLSEKKCDQSANNARFDLLELMLYTIIQKIDTTEHDNLNHKDQIFEHIETYKKDTENTMKEMESNVKKKICEIEQKMINIEKQIDSKLEKILELLALKIKHES